jgi:hypothetical protein
MTTTPDHLHDTALPGFEDRLWDELAEAHRLRQDQRPAVVTPHRPNRRRRPLAIGAAVAIAAATTLVIGIATLPGGEAPKAEASIEQRIIAATDAALDDSVVHVTTDFVPSSAGADNESWIDVTSLGVRSETLTDQGDVISGYGQAEAPRPSDPPPDFGSYDPSDVGNADCQTVTEPDGHQYQRCTGYTMPPGYPTSVVRYVQACDETYMDKEEPYQSTSFPELEVQEEIAAGHLAVDGTEVIDGQELIRLRDVATAELPEDFAVDQFVYVDPDTYLPVQLRSDVGGPDENVATFEYLPRTAANLELLVPPVPAGYTEVSDLAGC